MQKLKVMVEVKLKRIKLFFIVSLAILISLLIFGVLQLNGSYYWQGRYLAMQWLFLRTRIEYLMQNYSTFNSANQDNFEAIKAGRGAQSIPVLLYHGIIEDPNWTPDDVNTRLEDFRQQMLLLKSLGYETVKLDDFLAFLRGEKKLPAKSFLLTFDDGRKDSYYPVDPILRALGYRAVIFVITGRSLDDGRRENNFHLNEVELKKMAESGRWEIESHTQNGHDFERIDAQGNQGHFLSNKLWLKYEGRIETDEEYRQRIEQDLTRSKTDIESRLGTPVKAFAYPFGDFGIGSVNFPESRNIILPLVQKIFPYSFYQARESDFIGNYPGNSYHLVKRLNVNSHISPDRLATILLNSQDKNVSNYEDRFVSDRGWMEGWGRRWFKDGLMLTGPTNSEDSSLTYLDGSYLWQDYSFESEVQLVKGRAFALLARYQDGNNYASCDFGENELSINEHREGKDYTLAQLPLSYSQLFSLPAKAGISVKGQSMRCLLNEEVILSATLNPKLSQGGIGFKTWDKKFSNSELLVKQVNVKDISMAISGSSFRSTINP